MTVGFVEGGHAGNVIPESIRFGGTFRSMTSEGLLFLQQRIKEVNNIDELSNSSSNFSPENLDITYI